MNIVDDLAWIGTGSCDPNKELAETLIILAVFVGWAIIAYLLNRLRLSKLKLAAKIAINIIVILAALSATYIVYVATVIAYACSGG